MIANDIPSKKLIPVDLLEDLAKTESGRFLRAVDEAMAEMKKGVTGTPEEIVDKMEKIRRAGILLEFGIDELLEGGFALMKDPDHKRKGWEEYVSSARYIARPSRVGYMFQTIGSLFHLEETVDHTSALVEEGIVVLDDVQISLTEAKKFVEHYEYAVLQAKKYGVKEKRICRKYASLKTWTRKDELERFNTAADAAVDGGIEVIIEGPVRLYLMITPEQFMFILRGITSANVFEFATGGNKGLGATLTSLLNAQKFVERSPLYKTIRTLSANATKDWLADWKKEQTSLRSDLFSEGQIKHFIENFENGLCFSKGDEE